MFKSLKNLEAAFQYVRLFTLVVVVASVFISAFAIQQAYVHEDKKSKRIYLITPGGRVLTADAVDVAANVPAEIKDQVKWFHFYFFSLEPNQDKIDANVNQALALSDESAKEQYKDLRESGYYTGIVTGRITQSISMDSITVDTRGDQYHFIYYGKITIIRPSVIVTRSLISEGMIRQLPERFDANSHALLIERWKILENKDLTVTNRQL
jgi:conjugative transposon TraK protein